MIDRRSPRRWVLLGFLTAGMFFCYAQRGSLSVAAPFLMKDLGFNRAVMGVLLSAFFWSYSLAQVPAGWLIDRYGMERVYAAGFLIWTVAVALTSIPSTLAMLIAMRVLVGVGQGAAFPASAHGVAKWFPASDRGAVTGVYLSGVRFGQAAIAAVGPSVIVVHGWRFFFLLTGLAGLLWLVPWLFSIRWWEPASNLPSVENRPSLRRSLPLLRDRRIAGIFFGFFAYDYVWFLFINWMPGYLMLERKFGAREMSIYSSVPFVMVSVVTVLSGIFGDYLVRLGWNEVTVRKSLITVGLLIACCIVPAAFVQDKVASAWLLACSICGLGVAAPNTWALTQAVSSKQLVATASGIQNLGGNFGGAVAPVVTGFVAHVTGSFSFAFAIAGMLLLCGIASYWALIPKDSSRGSLAKSLKQEPL